MKSSIHLILLMLFLLSGVEVLGQATAAYAVQAEAVVDVATPQVTLHWKPLADATEYRLFRKPKESTTWQNLAVTTDTFYIDNNVLSDTLYEYRIQKAGGAINNVNGYIVAGINAPAIHHRGTMILLVDSVYTNASTSALATYMDDLSGDGWALIRYDVSREAEVTDIKKLIVDTYKQYDDVRAVQLVGHIPVPYSGNIAPDGHTPDHLGAWPADVYYADIDGNWTDVSVNNPNANRDKNKNIPGDGKWDQNVIPSNLELQIGRIDFHDLPVVPRSEIELLENYLDKAHKFKSGELYTIKRAVVDDNFGAFNGEAFAATAYRNFGQLIGRDNIEAADFRTTLADSAYLWAYGCGGGSYTSCSGVGNSSQFASGSLKGIFTSLFGSYFGDWDSQNNLLRVALSGVEPALVSFWSGRPNWFLHHMALGENIGYSALLTQNNNTIYAPTNHLPRGIHVALLGDLSLRTEYVVPASDLTLGSAADEGATLEWKASPDTDVIGYYIYKSVEKYGAYKRVSSLVSTNTYTDSFGTDGYYYYMIRPCKLEITPSGTYYNLGIGITSGAEISYFKPSAVAESKTSAKLLCFPNPFSDILNIFVSTNRVYQDIEVRITDIYGRQVKTFKLKNHQEEFTITDRFLELAPSTYIVQVFSSEQLLTAQKIVKIE